MKEIVLYDSAEGGGRGYRGRIARVFAEHLAKNGLRLTGQRRRILDLFLDSDRHLSQEEIYQTLRRHGVGRATVFRTMKTLQDARLVTAVVGPDGTARFEVNLDRPHHDHLICLDCGRIQEVSWPKLERIQEEACRRIGFEPRWHRHEVFGLCRACARRGAP